MRQFPSVNLTFTQDNASIHASRSTAEWLQANNVPTIAWLAKSPDINPIENVWGIIVRDIYEDFRQYENVEQLKTAIINAWDRINNDLLRNLVDSVKTSKSID